MKVTWTDNNLSIDLNTQFGERKKKNNDAAVKQLRNNLKLIFENKVQLGGSLIGFTLFLS